MQSSGQVSLITRTVDPPIPVSVDARPLWPRGPHVTIKPKASGLDLRYEVLGLLRERVQRGRWLGSARFNCGRSPRTRSGHSARSSNSRPATCCGSTGSVDAAGRTSNWAVGQR